MRIRMLVQKTGGRWDGQDWPDRGGELDVPDDEGAALCGQGDAVPVADGDSHVRADPDTADVETRGGTAPPSERAPKADWADHAVASGADPDEVAGLTKAQLVSKYGNGAL